VRPVTFLSDYGTDDEFVGVVHAVIARLAPEVRVIDISHGIERHGVLQGALMLARTLPYAPTGVHLAVVDPEVGARRRAVALRTGEEDRLLVGPDNGLLLPAAERFGGITELVEISESPWRLEPVAATFHGRDLFAPVAARLAAGAPLADAGPPLEPVELVPLDVPYARRTPGELAATVIGVDGFGNVSLLADHTDLAAAGLRLGHPVAVTAGERRLDATYARTFADVLPGDALVYEDAARTAAVAINTGDAAAALRVRPGAEVTIAAAVEPRAGEPAADEAAGATGPAS
jgi:S-adenosyl-L-methionine hydrolase (adenosine-forming)